MKRAILSVLLSLSFCAATANAQPDAPQPPAPPKTATPPDKSPADAKTGPDEVAQKAFLALMIAMETNDYARFQEDGDDAFKAAITQKIFEALVAQVGPRLRAGYETLYFGQLRQQGFVCDVWRLRFVDGGDDFLASLSMHDGKVGGFFLR